MQSRRGLPVQSRAREVARCAVSHGRPCVSARASSKARGSWFTSCTRFGTNGRLMEQSDYNGSF